MSNQYTLSNTYFLINVNTLTTLDDDILTM